MVKRLRRIAGPSWPLLLLKRFCISFCPRRRRRRRSRRGGSRRRKAGLGGKGGRGGGGVGGRDNSHSGGHRDSSSGGAVSEAVGEMGDPGPEVSRETAKGFVFCWLRPGARPPPRGDAWSPASGPSRRSRSCRSEQDPAATMAAPGPGRAPSSLLLLLRRQACSSAGSLPPSFLADGESQGPGPGFRRPVPAAPRMQRHNPTAWSSVLSWVCVQLCP